MYNLFSVKAIPKVNIFPLLTLLKSKLKLTFTLTLCHYGFIFLCRNAKY